MSKKNEVIDTAEAVTLFCFRAFDDLKKRGDSYMTIARSFGVSKTWVQNLHKNPTGHSVGPELEETLASKFFGGSVDTLRTEAVRAARSGAYPKSLVSGKTKGSKKEPGGDMIRRFSNAQLAAEWVARELKVSRERCLAVATENPFGLAPDAGVEEWRSALKLSLSGARKKVSSKTS